MRRPVKILLAFKRRYGIVMMSRERELNKMKMQKVIVANKIAMHGSVAGFVAANPESRVEYQNRKARCFSKTARVEYSYGR